MIMLENKAFPIDWSLMLSGRNCAHSNGISMFVLSN